MVFAGCSEDLVAQLLGRQRAVDVKFAIVVVKELVAAALYAVVGAVALVDIERFCNSLRGLPGCSA
tara:strand:- start:172 stop:369 length:198 start_codon:yes stop_codon:yes gene_type:complete